MSVEQFRRPGFAGILLALLCSSALAQEPGGAPGRSIYIGLFGGGGGGSGGKVTQLGTAMFPEVSGGPLEVHASGQSKTSGVGLVGVQIGHEWSNGPNLTPAFEIEAFYLTGSRHATLDNPSARLPEHAFDDTFKVHNTVLMANVVLNFRTPYQSIAPYIGAGIGAARISIRGANSVQLNPAEAGINHFNTGTDSSAWSFATQAKAGVRIALGSRAYLFGEYRYVFVDANNQVFGPTDYLTHVPTTEWNVRFAATSYHLAAGGIGFDF